MSICREGEIIHNRYRVEQLLGTGGYSKVYKVRRLADGKICALKVLAKELAEVDPIIQRFHKEAHILEDLDHPNIVKIYDVFISDKLIYYAMEYLEGKNLAEFLAQQKTQKPSWALAFLDNLLCASAFLHGKGILHRDLKPSNIVLLPASDHPDKGDKPAIKIIDFGIAKVLDGKETKTVGEILGTPLYMSPERLEKGTCTFSSDIYSIGEILWQILHGEERCKAMEITAMIAHKNKIPAIKLTQKSGTQGKDLLLLKEWLKKALHPEPAKRFQNCEEALEFIRNPAIIARIIFKKNAYKVAILCFFIFIVAGIILLSWYHYHLQLLHELQVKTTYVTGLDGNGKELWSFESRSTITGASIVEDISPTIKRAVIITTSTSWLKFDDPQDCGFIWLLDVKGKEIWHRQLCGKEWLPGIVPIYENTFWFAEDLDNDSRKELIFTSLNYASYTSILLVLRPDKGDYYGMLWCPGDQLQSLKLWRQNGKNNLLMLIADKNLESRLITRIEVNHPFWSVAPGWSADAILALEKASLSFGKQPGIAFIKPVVALFDFIKQDSRSEINIIKKNDNMAFYEIVSQQVSLFFTADGYPVFSKGAERYMRNIQAASPDLFLWNLNPYFSFIEKRQFQEAGQLCNDLDSQIPGIPQYAALLHLLKGKAALRMGDRATAIDNLKKSLTIRHIENKALGLLAESYILENKLEEAKKILTEYAMHNPIRNCYQDEYKYLLYIYALTMNEIPPGKRKGRSQILKVMCRSADPLLGEQHLLYEADPTVIPLWHYYSFDLPVRFWRWRVAREVLLQNSSLMESWKQVPSLFYDDPGLHAIKFLVENQHDAKNLLMLEKSAQGDLEDYLFLSVTYVLYARDAQLHHNQQKAKEYATKALHNNPVGFIKTLADSIKKEAR